MLNIALRAIYFFTMNKPVAILVSVVAFLASAFLSYSIVSSNGIGPSLNTSYKPPTSSGDTNELLGQGEPLTEECPLNGQKLPKSFRKNWEKRRPLIIMVENHTEARPQSGLSSADTIYEAVAEGGITRFMTVFYCRDAKYVGPVRSARIYFVRLAQGYGNSPLYAHVGGANTDGPADALGELDHIGWGGYNDLNQFSVPFPNFYRDPDRLPNRATEHTVYTSTSKLWDYAATKRKLTNKDEDGVAWDKNFDGWKFKDDAKQSDRGTVNKIGYGFWNSLSSDFKVDWAYDATTNSYVRSNGGAPHIDKNTGKPITSKNVIVVFADESPANDGYEGGHILYDIIGSGDALIFQDGKVIKGSWVKDDAKSMMHFYDASKKEVSLVRGQDFISILPIGNKVTY